MLSQLLKEKKSKGRTSSKKSKAKRKEEESSSSANTENEEHPTLSHPNLHPKGKITQKMRAAILKG